MTDLLEDLEVYFKANGIVEPVYRDFIPDYPDNVIVLYEYEGSAGIPQTEAYRRPVQIFTRGKVATDTKLLARRLHKLLTTETGILSITSERTCVVDIMQTPFRMGTDDAQRARYGFNVGFITHND